MSLVKKFTHFNGNMYGMGLIRTLLALSVVISHSSLLLGYNIANGFVAVQVFYMFSGFYMFMILTERYTSITQFYKSRALRLYPTYFIVFLFAFSIWYFFGEGSAEGLEKQNSWNTLNLGSKLFVIAANISVFFQDIIMFLAINPNTGDLYFTKNFHQEALPAFKLLMVPQAWTIGVELTFYLLAPFFVKRKTVTLCIFILISMSARFYLKRYGFKNDPWNYRFFPFEIALFLLGGLGYRFYTRLVHFKISSYVSPIVLILAFSLIILFHFLNIAGNSMRTMLFYGIMGIAIPFIFHASRKNINDRNIGELSYPIYLTHHIILSCFYLFLGEHTSILYEKQLLCIPIIILSMSISWGINKYIQHPIDMVRRGQANLITMERVAITEQLCQKDKRNKFGVVP